MGKAREEVLKAEKGCLGCFVFLLLGGVFLLLLL